MKIYGEMCDYGGKAKVKNGAHVFAGVAVIFTLIDARELSEVLTPLTPPTLILWFMP